MELIRNIYSIAYVVAGASFGLLAIAAVAEWKLPYLVTQALTAGVGFGLVVGVLASVAARRM